MSEPTLFAPLRAKSPTARLPAALRAAGLFAFVLAGSGIGVPNLNAATTSAPGAELPARTNINPGLLYWQAFSALPRSDEATQNELTGFADQLSKWSQASSAEWSIRLPTNSDSLLERYDRPLRLLQKARSSVKFTWGSPTQPQLLEWFG